MHADTWELQAYDSAKKRYRYKTVKADSAPEANKLLAAFVAGRADHGTHGATRLDELSNRDEVPALHGSPGRRSGAGGGVSPRSQRPFERSV